MPDKNSKNHKTTWIMGITAGLIITIGGGWIASIDAKITKIRDHGSHHGERISAVEARTDGIYERLTRIEDKLDRIIEGAK